MDIVDLDTFDEEDDEVTKPAHSPQEGITICTAQEGINNKSNIIEIACPTQYRS